MDKTKMVKTTLHYAADIGGGLIVAGIVKSNVHTNNIIIKVPVVVASYALGNVIGRAAAAEIDDSVDRVIAIFKEKPTETPVTE